MTDTHALSLDRDVSASPSRLFAAFTTGWGAWFGEPDTARLSPQVGAPFFFEVAQRTGDGAVVARHPHYGRFLRLVPDALVSLTWVTGAAGTAGAETVLTLRLEPRAAGVTTVALTHEGFLTAEGCERHARAWPMVLDRLAQALASSAATTRPEAVAPATLRPNRSIPDATLIPVRSYPDLEGAVAWMRDALGCRERLRIPGHRVQLTIGNGAVVAVAWNASSDPSAGRPPATLMVRVADVDATYARALALGATGVTPPASHPYGERQAVLKDPFGHSWTLSQTVADVDPASWGGELV
ncbi:MAG TPA: SRPBCC domain-containing protein [Gemmatimonadaceae bacterium]|nr:SRPBCC domain-containing protein [Gemmatimonadaceae bacterium]